MASQIETSIRIKYEAEAAKKTQQRILLVFLPFLGTICIEQISQELMSR